METFTIVKRGYNPEEVDAYIATLEQVIKSYKDKDNAIKNAIISAQVAADNIVKNAHLQAGDYKNKVARQLANMKETIAIQRVRVKSFQELYIKMLQNYIKEFNEQDIKELIKNIDEIELTVHRMSEMEENKPESAAAGGEN